MLNILVVALMMSAAEAGHFLSRGGNTYKIPLELYRLNRQRLCDYVKRETSGAVVYLQGKPKLIRNNDVDYLFRQVP